MYCRHLTLIIKGETGLLLDREPGGHFPWVEHGEWEKPISRTRACGEGNRKWQHANREWGDKREHYPFSNEDSSHSCG